MMSQKQLKKLKLAWDWPCGMPKLYLSYILRNVLPPVKCNSPSDVYKELVSNFYAYHDMNFVFSGCVYDDTYVPPVIVPAVESLNHLSVLLVENNIKVMPEGVGDENEHVVASQIKDTDQVKMLFPKIRTDQMVNYDTMHSRSGEVEIKGIHFSCEYIIAIPHPVWPEVAKEWTTRERKMEWPSKETIQNITSSGCHVVKSCDVDSQSEWFYNFTEAEQFLMITMNHIQKHCFRYFKFVCNAILRTPGLLTIQDLKMLFFWVCEGTPDVHWTDENLGACLLQVLDELMSAVASKHLPHYFMRHINIFEDKDDEILCEFGAKLADFRHKPLKFLLSRNFSFQPRMFSLNNVFQPLLDDIKLLRSDIDLQQFALLICSCTKILRDGYVAENQLEETRRVGEDFSYFLGLFDFKVNLRTDGKVELRFKPYM